jgi:hypothetical protein
MLSLIQDKKDRYVNFVTEELYSNSTTVRGASVLSRKLGSLSIVSTEHATCPTYVDLKFAVKEKSLEVSLLATLTLLYKRLFLEYIYIT